MATGQPLLAFLIVLTVLVFVHEWGHYIVARINGVRVEVFSVGFGPEIWGYNDKHGTRWKISWIPLGGYVKFFGDATEASTPDQSLIEMSEEEKAVSFHHKNLWQKSAIVFAGPAVNFLFAILIIAGMFFTYGRLVNLPEVGGVVEGGAAIEAGIEAGDHIISIDGDPVESFRDITTHLMLKVENDVTVVLLRDGKELTFDFELNVLESTNLLGEKTQIRQIGIYSNPEAREVIEYGLFGALWQATIETKNLTLDNLKGMKQILVGDRSPKELGGPISIARVAAITAEYGIVQFINFMALVSIGLGMINLFPIPMLDGGHLLYYGIEAVRRKKMSLAAQEFGFKIGAVVVLSLMIFVFYNDIYKSLYPGG